MAARDATRAEIAEGRTELRAARRRSRVLFWAVGLFSMFVNLLMLTGPLYMLNVYDRVLGSRSIETLLALTLLVGFLYGMMALLDYARGRIMGRVGGRFQTDLEERVFGAVMRAQTMHKAPAEAATGLKDLEGVQRMLTSPALMAFFDLPWTPIFLFGIFLFHPWLGYLALFGGGILVVIALINQWTTRRRLATANAAVIAADRMGEHIRAEAEMVQSLGMRDAAFTRWLKAREEGLKAAIGAGDASGTFSTLTKAFRLFLQSAMLGLGAYIVLQGDLTPGAMIAGSILLGRALAPVELLVNQWAVLQRGFEGWERLAHLLGAIRPLDRRTDLPRPRAILEANQITVVPPGDSHAALRMVSFRAEPGQAIGVIGPSGAGKSTLAKVLVGLWKPAGGHVRLDGAALDQYDPDVLGRYVGYLPQRVHLFEGTIRDNIARLSQAPDDAGVVAAARKAAAHDMIVRLPDGYDTRVDAGGGRLSGGQLQRIGLARALYGDPVMLVLDEPNSNLDNEGTVALNSAVQAMRDEGKLVFIMAHRPAAIAACDSILYIDGGAARAFGPKDEVLKKVLANAGQIEKGQGSGGGVT
ncbi:MAG: type 1 secretion system ATPase component [Rhodobacteraceae bacterium HLUCCA08]|nr:MAG: type 1 secretion system ATPase component [Rhodobacteraceae bacterium HLUCCA08]